MRLVVKTREISECGSDSHEEFNTFNIKKATKKATVCGSIVYLLSIHKLYNQYPMR